MGKKRFANYTQEILVRLLSFQMWRPTDVFAKSCEAGAAGAI